MTELLQQSDALVANVSLRFKRYLFHQIEWESRLVGIKGARGTGKTTLVLQWLNTKGLPSRKALYVSLDDLYFSSNTLVDTGKEFYRQGGQILVLDEVHKYPGWSREIKNLYDLFPGLQIIFTGSSIIDISRQEGDLSRRVLMYELHGLSFREYLQLNGLLEGPTFSIEQLTVSPEAIRKKFPSYFRPLEHFHAYLSKGYYPFFQESEAGYHQRLQQLIRTIVEYDMAELKGFDIRNAKKMLQLLYIIAQNVPFQPNLSALASKSKIHRNSLNNYFHFLEEARLVGLLYPSGTSVATLQKPEKIFLNNTDLLFALSTEQPNRGTVREVFFYSQAKVAYRLTQPKKGDFHIDDQYIFEIGGKDETNRQLQTTENAWLVKDDLEYPAGQALPLWVFGFLY